MQRRLLASQVAEQEAKLAAIDGQIAQKEAERATIKASIDKLKATIQPCRRRAGRHPPHHVQQGARLQADLPSRSCKVDLDRPAEGGVLVQESRLS